MMEYWRVGVLDRKAKLLPLMGEGWEGGNSI